MVIFLSETRAPASQMSQTFNPGWSEFSLENIQIYLDLLSFPYAEMAHIVESFPDGRQE